MWIRKNTFHDDVNKWKKILVTGPLCGEFTGERWIPLTQASDTELWCFLGSAPQKHSWVNNRDAGDLTCHRAHYDVTVMGEVLIKIQSLSLTEIRLKVWATQLIKNILFGTQQYNCPLQWRHNGRDSVSNNQSHDCLLNRFFRRRSKKTSKLRLTGLC